MTVRKNIKDQFIKIESEINQQEKKLSTTICADYADEMKQ